MHGQLPVVRLEGSNFLENLFFQFYCHYGADHVGGYTHTCTPPYANPYLAICISAFTNTPPFPKDDLGKTIACVSME